MSSTASQSHPYLFERLSELLRKVDRCKYTLERAECVLELLHFCADEGRVLLDADERVREMMLRRCREYHETALYYQEIAGEASRILTMLSQEPTAPTTTTVSYDPTAHHC